MGTLGRRTGLARSTCRTSSRGTESSDKADSSELAESPDQAYRADRADKPDVEGKQDLDVVFREAESDPHEAERISYFPDGACIGNGKPHAKASWALWNQEQDIAEFGCVPATYSHTNQTAEVYAAIEALRNAIKRGLVAVNIVADSEYVEKAINSRIRVWADKGWLDFNNKPLANADLFRELENLMNKIDVKAKKVKAHTRIVGNESTRTSHNDLHKLLLCYIY